MKTATWGWYPPLYQKYESGKYMVLYNPSQFEETVTHVDHETNEETTETITRWNVWYEYLELPEVTEALSNDNEIQALKLILENIITLYDTSTAVNEFTINGIPVWLDKNTRAGLKLRFESEIALGKTETVLWYNKKQFVLPLNTAVELLHAIEIYASACYDNTQMHLAQIDELTTVEDIQNYDYRSGYPEKLKF